MNKRVSLGLLSILFCGCVFAKTTVLNFSPSSDTYTNVVQDIAVYQEACQNNTSGHYYSKMYDFTYEHDVDDNCIVAGGSLLKFTVVLDNDAKRVVKILKGPGGATITYKLKMNSEENDNSYTGTMKINK